jgi:hypothetical protein
VTSLALFLAQARGGPSAIAKPTNRQILSPLFDDEVLQRIRSRYNKCVRDGGRNPHDVPRMHHQLVALVERSARAFSRSAVRAPDEAVAELDGACARAHDDEIIPASVHFRLTRDLAPDEQIRRLFVSRRVHGSTEPVPSREGCGGIAQRLLRKKVHAPALLLRLTSRGIAVGVDASRFALCRTKPESRCCARAAPVTSNEMPRTIKLRRTIPPHERLAGDDATDSK